MFLVFTANRIFFRLFRTVLPGQAALAREQAPRALFKRVAVLRPFLWRRSPFDRWSRGRCRRCDFETAPCVFATERAKNPTPPLVVCSYQYFENRNKNQNLWRTVCLYGFSSLPNLRWCCFFLKPFSIDWFSPPLVPQMIDAQAMALQTTREQLLGEKVRRKHDVWSTFRPNRAILGFDVSDLVENR